MSSRNQNEPESAFDMYARENPNASVKQIKNFVTGVKRESSRVSSSDESLRRSDRRPVPKRKADSPVSTVSHPRSTNNEPSESEEEEEEEEDHLEDGPSGSGGHSSDGDDYIPNASERAKRKRKSAQNYNERHLMLKQVNQSAPSKRKRGRPRMIHAPKLAKTETFNTITEALNSVNKEETSQEVVIYNEHGSKDYGDSASNPQERQFVSLLDNLDEVVAASGGFQLFVRTMPDLCCVKLSEYVIKNYDRTAFPVYNDTFQVAQFLRHVWNKLPIDVRKKWEKSARKVSKKCIKTEDGTEVVHLTMPPSEFPFETNRRPPMVKTEEDCCASKMHQWKRFADVQAHFINHHKQLIYYACNYCGHLFQTSQALTKHCEKNNNCPEFRSLLLHLALESATVEMGHCSFYLTCSDCALWLPISDLNHSEKEPSFGWHFLMKLLEYHSPCSLMLVSIYSVKPIEKHEKLENFPLLLSYTPDMIRNLPSSCNECKIEFMDVNECNDHFKTTHPDKVIKCPFTDCKESFGTESHFRLHMQVHQHSNAYLANYIRTRAPVYPPSQSGGVVSIGLTDIPMVGGMLTDGAVDSNRGPMVYHRKLNNDEIEEVLVDQKLKNALVNSVSLLDDSENDEANPEGRIDMGIEHLIDYRINSSKAQLECRAKLNALFSKQPTQRLNATCVINDPEVLLNSIGADENADKLAKKAQKFEMTTSENPLVSSIMKLGTMQAKLPTWACSLALDGYLLNKNYWLCTECNSLLGSAAILEKHMCDKEKIIVLFSNSERPNSRLQCHICDDTVCSIVGLREHYIGHHTTWIEFIVDSEITDDTLTAMATKAMETTKVKKSAIPVGRSEVAHKTDEAFGLAPAGCFPKKKIIPPAPPMVSAPSTYSSVPRRPLRPVEVHRPPAPSNRPHITEKPPMRSNRPVVHQAPLNPKMRTNPERLHPFVEIMTTEGKMLRCSICPMGSRALPLAEMKKHLREKHSFECNGCGQHFAEEPNASFHNCCSKLYKHVPYKFLTGKCSACPKYFNLLDLIQHVFSEHMQLLKYGSITGKWYPAFMEVSISDDYIVKQREMTGEDEEIVEKTPSVIKRINFVHSRTAINRNLASHYPVYKPPLYKFKGGHEHPLNIANLTHLKMIPDSHLCYLCGIDCSSKKDLEDHYSLHPENYTACPLCSVRIVSHEAMAEHLRAKHYREVYDRSSNKMKLMCNHCSRKLNMPEVSHVLFECPRPPICGLCEDYSTDNPSSMGQHFHREHRDQVDRFRCSVCTQKFYSIFAFATHTCNYEMVPHKCECGHVLSDRQAFTKHFVNSHIEPVELNCNLCGFTSGRLLHNAISHRQRHLQLTLRENDRKCHVLDRKLYKIGESVVPNGRKPVAPRSSSSDTDDIEVIEQPPKLTPQKKERNESSASAVIVRRPPVVSEATVIKSLLGDMISFIIDEEKTEAGDWDKSEYGRISPIDVNISSRPGSADLVATVRTEDDETAGTSSCVAQFRYDASADGDDDIECISVPQNNSQSEALITTINDDGDEELQVLATVQNPPGTLSSNVSSRSAKFKCCHCSATFLTQASVEAHTLTQHQSDAGGILDETYGLPKTDKPVFICRCCCVAFETVGQQKDHMNRHRSSKTISCKDCSAFAYNFALEKNHREAHLKQIGYYCSECQIQFKKESRLYFHLKKHHDVPLLFFCKECGLASQDIDVIHRHLQISRKCEKALSSVGFDVRQQGYGICPASLLHFQPLEVSNYISDIANNRFELVTPSDCTHRSFLAATNSVICCKECFCLKNMQQFMAEQSLNGETHMPFYAKNIDDRIDCPFAPGILRPSYRIADGNATAYRYSMPGNAVKEMHEQQQTQWRNVQPNLYTQRSNNRPVTSQPVLPQMLNRIMPRNIQIGIQKPYSPTMSSSPMVRPMQNGVTYTLRRPATIATDGQGGRIQVFSQRLRPAPSSLQRVTMPTVIRPNATSMLTNLQDVITLEEDIPGTAHTIPAKTVGTFSRTATERYMEAKKKNNFYCIDCKMGFENEKRAVEHIYLNHCPIEKQSTKSAVFSLECPFKCSNSRFATLTAYKQHLASTHSRFAKHRSLYCAVSFLDEDSCKAHCKAHEQHEEEYGMMGLCCELCGCPDNWADTVGSVKINHMAIHGTDLFAACKDCNFAPGPNCPNQIEVLLAHFMKRHVVIASTEGSHCRICGGKDILDSEKMAEHFKAHHMVSLFRPRLTTSADQNTSSIVPLIKTNAATQKFLGLPVDNEWRINELNESELHVFRLLCKADKQI